jgi:uncharacterized coiled-coil protein SlyX
MKIIIRLFLAFLCLSIAGPKAHAVSPAPDGAYPGGNTAEGQAALLSLTTGGFNTAVGFFSLRSNTTNSFNTALGAGALFVNTSDENTAAGAGALLSNTTGGLNTANGAFALVSNTTGSGNTAIGGEALFSNTTGGLNTVTGGQALTLNTEGFSNTATGFRALVSNITGNDNTANGVLALGNNTTGNNNTANGDETLNRNTTGGFNTAIGAGALPNNTTGRSNTALGINAGAGVTTADNVICIGADVDGENVSNTCYIGNIFGVTSVGISVLVNSAGKLGTTTSSQRFKDSIKPMDQASEALFALKPVAFRYKKDIDPAGTPQFGLVAEEVEKVNHDLVVRDKEGNPYSVRYDQVNAMLLNEFLKEHRKVEEQRAAIRRLETTVAKQEKGLQVVTARLDEQAAQIQKVSAQLAAATPSRGELEPSRPAPQVALNNP